ncbi:MAG: hypothetical protein MI741_21955 [Rhodospirillales bacterium]|nr:hypothetical protein [Rhodospirillales bacterium]
MDGDGASARSAGLIDDAGYNLIWFGVIYTITMEIAVLTPLALSDPGWSPLCMAVIFGGIAATVGALVFIPALYPVPSPKDA